MCRVLRAELRCQTRNCEKDRVINQLLRKVNNSVLAFIMLLYRWYKKILFFCANSHWQQGRRNYILFIINQRDWYFSTTDFLLYWFPCTCTEWKQVRYLSVAASRENVQVSNTECISCPEKEKGMGRWQKKDIATNPELITKRACFRIRVFRLKACILFNVFVS